MSTSIQDDRWTVIQPLLERGAKLIQEKEILIEALKDIARQPEGDEQSAQAIAREVLARFGETL